MLCVSTHGDDETYEIINKTSRNTKKDTECTSIQKERKINTIFREEVIVARLLSRLNFYKYSFVTTHSCTLHMITALAAQRPI